MMRTIMTGTAHQILFRWSHQEGWDGQGMWHTGGTRGMHTEFWWGNFK